MPKFRPFWSFSAEIYLRRNISPAFTTNVKSHDFQRKTPKIISADIIIRRNISPVRYFSKLGPKKLDFSKKPSTSAQDIGL